jgi:hypothetical protein
MTGILKVLLRALCAPPSTENQPQKSSDSARLAVDLARDDLAAELSAMDSDDLKSLGYFAAAVAGAAALVAAYRPGDPLHPVANAWWVPVSLFAASALSLMISLRKRRFPAGPNPLGIYYSNSPAPMLDAVTDLVRTAEAVRNIRSHWSRRIPFRVSVSLLFWGGILAGLELFGVLWFHA